MAVDDPKALLERANSAADGGNAVLAQDLLRTLIANHPNSPEATTARATIDGSPALLSAGRIQVVRVADLDIAFMTMIGLFLKAAFAMIPAVIVLAIIWAVVAGVVGGFLAALAQ